VRAALLVSAALLALAGCGGTTIDGGALEDEIIEDAEREGLVIDDADCPSPDAAEGDTFGCTVTVKGEERQLEIVQRNDDGNVEYDLTPLVETSVGSDAGGDEASVRSTVDAVRGDVTALCDFAVPAYRRQLSKEGNCAKEVLAEFDDDFLGDYEVSVSGDDATGSDGERTVVLERQRDGSWLITDVR